MKRTLCWDRRCILAVGHDGPHRRKARFGLYLRTLRRLDEAAQANS